MVQDVLQTLGGSERNWFNDLDPKSVDGFEELSRKFLEEFAQHKRYAKDSIEIHGIKRNPNESIQAFMDRFKAESSYIKRIPPILRISAFMHRHGHLERPKKPNDKIPNTVDEMCERVRAFIRGETADAVKIPYGEKGTEKATYPSVQGRSRNRNNCRGEITTESLNIGDGVWVVNGLKEPRRNWNGPN
ncbi:reverse transcriptase domain-containing protein [Artemisia annua]|uniref:Reverse transcriptase domain-containing protein n=1 Tax=Artemisia annua TaxID=35608 RepID=A0A2U1Q6S3_ARTAN|nr:reverse transcriptase domain-containing protein [Artemisia annua]